MATLRTQPCGSRRAPANCARETAFLQFILQRLFVVWIGVFADDCFCMEPEGTVAPALSPAKSMCKPPAMHLAWGKGHPPFKEMEILGAHIAILRDSLMSSITPRMFNDYAVVIRNFLSRGHVPWRSIRDPRDSGVSQSLMFGRFGRAFPQPLTGRKYSSTRTLGDGLSAQLRATLLRWSDTLHADKPRRVAFTAASPVAVYTDAQGRGHVSGVPIPPGARRPRMWHGHIPEWVRCPDLEIGIS